MTTKTTLIAMLISLALCFAFASCGEKEGGQSGNDATAAIPEDDDEFIKDEVGDKDDPVDPVPSDSAFLRPGPTDDQRWILPNGRFLSPVGQSVGLDRFPMSMMYNSEHDYLYVAFGKKGSNMVVINALTMEIVAEVELPGHFGGMKLNSDESILWVGCGVADEVREFFIEDGMPVFNRSIPAAGYPTDIEISGDEQTMYVSMAFGKKVSAINIATGAELLVMNSGTYTYNIAVSEGADRLIATNWGTWAVSVFRHSDGVLLADIEVGKNPEGVVLGSDGTLAYVACSDTDDIYEIDLIDLEVKRSFSLYPDQDTTGLGAFATQLELSDDGDKLYVAASGFNSIDVIDIESGQVEGRIPTSWYPTAVKIKNDRMIVTNANGLTLGNAQTRANTDGSVEFIEMPDEQTLAQYTEMVLENNIRTSAFYDDSLDYDSPIPSTRGVRSQQIKHIVFILKENKTFDQVMSDMPGAESDPGLLVFGEQYTPNLHALAREFAYSDNYYSESHDSDLGHSWATGVMANDYVEKLYRADGWMLMTGVEPAAVPASKTVFHKMVESGVSFRVYGEVVGTLADMELFAPHVDFNFGFYTHTISDRIRAQECIREFEAGIFPDLIFICLPNDHTDGTSSGSPTMEYFVGDNDAGMGMIVDWIMKSEYWPETAIFVTQDDPQSGTDHIDPHRTPLTVISPYAKRGHISHVHHSMASLWLTFELILGMPPLTNYDRFTAPLYDFFDSEQNLDADFNAIPSNFPYEINPSGLVFQDYCDSENWDVPDQVERIGEVTWAYMRPGEPYPHQYALEPDARESEEEEAEEGANFRKTMRAYIEYGRDHDLFDPAWDVSRKKIKDGWRGITHSGD